jgi:tetratricopeptide (TPR) repeat protein
MPQREPKSVRRLIRLATVRIALGDPDHALGDASDTMYFEPRNASARVVRGNPYRAKSYFKRAIDDYTAAIAFNPHAQFFHERGVAYRMKGDRAHAIDDFKYAVHLLPKDMPDSIAELKKLGVDMSDYDPMKLPTAKDMLNSLK